MLFAIREVPQSSTGLSPFELLCGRQPQGILDLAKETWEEPVSSGKSIMEHVLEMQDWIERVTAIFQRHMEQSQSRKTHNYNKCAKA